MKGYSSKLLNVINYIFSMAWASFLLPRFPLNHPGAYLLSEPQEGALRETGLIREGGLFTDSGDKCINDSFLALLSWKDETIGLLAILENSLERAIFLYNFIHFHKSERPQCTKSSRFLASESLQFLAFIRKVRLSDVRALTAFIHFLKFYKISFGLDPLADSQKGLFYESNTQI